MTRAGSPFLFVVMVAGLMTAGCVANQERETPLIEDLLPVAAPSSAFTPVAADGIVKLRCFPIGDKTGCNFETTVSPETRQGNEVTVAVNPKDAGNIVAGAKDYTPDTAGECVWDGVYSTHDAGKTWSSKSLPGSPWLLVNDAGSFELNEMSNYWCATDPVVAFGPDGTFYYAVMAYQGDPVTASKIGKDQTGTGVNDVVFNRVAQVCAVSTDGGKTFDSFNVIDVGSFPVNFHDRQWITVDQYDGSVHVAWTSGLAFGNVAYRSTDKCKTWQGPVLLDDQTNPLGPTPGQLFMSTGPANDVWISGRAGDGPYFSKSTDGGATFSPWKRAVEAEDKGMNATYRSAGLGFIAVDSSKGPHSGNAYLAFADTRNGDRDMFLTRSTDGGASWSEPVRLNDDALGNGVDQFFPAISVSPKGIVDVAWYDRRNGDNYLLDLYYSYSDDGGATWSPNFRVTEVSSDPKWSIHQAGFVFIGDYIDMDSSVEGAHPVWVDTRHEKADVFVASILRPIDPK
ncbi:MAG: exo-alpha-sialidase [Euryarchaeota archaeon]|nr:exo-alpha-sialidase [Euryarchaeota archaeon]